MSLTTKKKLIITVGLAMFIAGCIMIGMGSIEVPLAGGPNGGGMSSVRSYAATGFLCVIVGPLLAVQGILKGNVPKWIA